MATLKKRKRRKYNAQRGGGILDKFFSFFSIFGKGKSSVQEEIEGTGVEEMSKGNGQEEGADSRGGSKRRKNSKRDSRIIGSRRRRRSKKILVY